MIALKASVTESWLVVWTMWLLFNNILWHYSLLFLLLGCYEGVTACWKHCINDLCVSYDTIAA